jgi:hypothetical protein
VDERHTGDVDGHDPAVVDQQLRAALAARLGLDRASIDSPVPGVLIARSADGTVLRLDYRTYQSHELTR